MRTFLIAIVIVRPEGFCTTCIVFCIFDTDHYFCCYIDSVSNINYWVNTYIRSAVRQRCIFTSIKGTLRLHKRVADDTIVMVFCLSE